MNESGRKACVKDALAWRNRGGSCVSLTGTMSERGSAGRRVQGQPEDEG